MDLAVNQVKSVDPPAEKAAGPMTEAKTTIGIKTIFK